MKNSLKISAITTIFLSWLTAGCSTTAVVMNTNPILKANSTEYEITYPDSFADIVTGKRLNVSFGPYRVTDADPSWTRIASEAENPRPLFDFSHSKTDKSGKTTTTIGYEGGPTSVFGFTRPAELGEPTIDRASSTVTYKFKAGPDTTWDAKCLHEGEKRVTQYETSSDVEILWTKYTCKYTKEGGDEEWNLNVAYTPGYPLTVTLSKSNSPMILTAHPTGGRLVKKDGTPIKTTMRTAGYTWEDEHQYIAAIATDEKPPKVWIEKRLSESIREILAMASTGLLVYKWEINN